MLLKRWLTSIVLLPALLFLIFMGGPLPFLVLIAVANLLALREYFGIAFHPESDPLLSGISYVAGTALIWGASRQSFGLLFWVLVLNVIGAGILTVVRFGTDPRGGDRLARESLGVIYVSLLLSCLVLIRNSVDGPAWILIIICLAFAGDTGAFYAGTYLGRRKLCPAVSPNKTIEGAIGGLAASTLVASAVKYFLLPSLPWGTSLVMFVLAAAAGQTGDLFESVLKRAAGVKDSGAILPGHGGILDRIDALLFVAPVALFFKMLVFS
jgi:phosphatidate cytidylyltransferase